MAQDIENIMLRDAWWKDNLGNPERERPDEPDYEDDEYYED